MGVLYNVFVAAFAAIGSFFVRKQLDFADGGVYAGTFRLFSQPLAAAAVVAEVGLHNLCEPDRTATSTGDRMQHTWGHWPRDCGTTDFAPQRASKFCTAGAARISRGRVARLALGARCEIHIPGTSSFALNLMIQKGRMDEAKKSLRRLHGTATNSEFLELEFAEMVEQIRYEQANYAHHISDLWSMRPMLRRTLTGIAVQVCTQPTGINVSSYFQPTLYSNLGYSGSTVLLIQGINGVLGAIVLMFFITFVIDRVGRKPPLIIGSLGMAASLAIEAAINKHYGAGSDNVAAQRTGVALIILFGSFFCTSFGPISWIYQSEIFPMRVRAVGTSVCTMANWASKCVAK